MKNALRFFCFVLLVAAPAATAQLAPHPVSPQGPPSAHVPPAFLAAKTVFLSNAGADSGLFPSPFSGSPDRGYQQLYAALEGWNHYKIVDDPAAADLVLELRLIAPTGPKNPDKTKGSSDPLPMFRLVVYQRSTHYVLWAFTASVENAFLQKTHDRNFDLALEELANDLKRVAEQPAVTAP